MAGPVSIRSVMSRQGWPEDVVTAPVAQLDRVLASEARGRAFESRRARQII